MVVTKNEHPSHTDSWWLAGHGDGSGAVAVAEHAAVHISAEFAHLGAFGIGGGVV